MNPGDAPEGVSVKTVASHRTQEPAARRWFRHSAAVLATLALNVLLVAFLMAWMERSRRERSRPLWAVPVEVTDAVPEEMEVADETADDVAGAPLPPEPVLPALPLPERAAVEASASGALPLLFDAIATPSLEIPPYSVEAPAAGPAPARPAAKAGPGPTRRVGTRRGPVLIQPPDLAAYYPRRARMGGVTGKTSVRLTVGADGRVRGVEVLSSTPAGVFENAAQRVGRSLQFRPALKNGRPTAVTVSLNLIWRIE